MSDFKIYRSYAKINLYLDVICRRDDGYHDIETIFQTVSLSDTLRVRPLDSRIELTCSAPEAGTIDDNLVYRAAQLLRSECGCVLGAGMELEKEIPVAAGLAGGSGDAAAALIALNDLWALDLSEEQLRALALQLGSDVPYCLNGGTMAATGRGEIMEKLSALPETWFVLLHPLIRVSTPSAYQHPRLGLSEESPIDGKTPSFRTALHDFQSGELSSLLYNRMENAVFTMYPELRELKKRLVESGCSGALMSGSGPTLFGICADEEEAERIAKTFPDVEHSVVRSVDNGVVTME